MSAELKYWYLKDHKLFRSLSFSEISQLCIITKFKKSKKGDEIEFPYTEKPRIYFLKKGVLKLVEINKDGDRVVKEILQKGDLFGELDFSDEAKKQDEFVKVVSEDALICAFYREDLEKVMLQKPEFALSYIKFMGFSIKRLKNNYSNIFFKDAKTRLILFIHTLLDREQKEITDNYILHNYLTQLDIAQLICATRQTVTSLLTELEKEKIISYSQKEIKVLNYAFIKKVVNNVK